MPSVLIALVTFREERKF